MPRPLSGETKTYNINRSMPKGVIYVYRRTEKYDPEIKRMRKAGITVPEYSDEEGDIRYYITEAEAERMNLAEKVLALEGDDPNAFPGIKCSKCGSGYIAALTYTTLKNYQIDGTTMRAETESPLFLKTNHRIPGCESRNAFLCLQCGTEFELQLKENR